MILSAIVEKLKRQSKDDFKGRQFEAWLIIHLSATKGRSAALLLQEPVQMLESRLESILGLVRHFRPKCG